MQPYIFPYIGYFKLINEVDTFVLFDDVNFIKKGWINRNNILVNKKAFLFTIPVKGASQNKLINEMQINDQSYWKQDFLKTILQAYSKAPFFHHVYPVIQQIIEYPENDISKFILHSLKVICGYIKINTEIILSSDIQKNNTIKGQDKIIQICSKLKATEYINASGGKTLYNENEFLEENISLKFSESPQIIYTQFKNEFIANLSIIDVMMFNPSEAILDFLNI